MTRLSVNLNKIALLRNARGEGRPDPVRAAETVVAAGAHGLTVHPRPDLRHIRPDDVRRLAEVARDRVEFNIEGNPFAPPRGDYPGLLALVRETGPDQVTLVPDSEEQLTSDHGFDPVADARRLAPLIADLAAEGCRVSLFVDAGIQQLRPFAEMGAARIEIYTGPFALARESGTAETAIAACKRTAEAAAEVGLAVNAGHDLSQANLAELLTAIPDLAEVSIGHALIEEALYDGLHITVGRYLALISAARPG